MNLTRIRTAQFKVRKYFVFTCLKIGILFFLEYQCTNVVSRWLTGNDVRSQGRKKCLESYGIFSQEKPRWFLNLKLQQICYSGLLCCNSESHNV